MKAAVRHLFSAGQKPERNWIWSGSTALALLHLNLNRLAQRTCLFAFAYLSLYFSLAPHYGSARRYPDSDWRYPRH
jgi:hypothetical protein